MDCFHVLSNIADLTWDYAEYYPEMCTYSVEDRIHTWIDALSKDNSFY